MSDYNALEKRQAQKDGARLVANSGRNIEKGDAILGDLLIDYKFSERKTFTFNLDKFRKHEADAWKKNRNGVFVMCFIGQFYEAEYAVVHWPYLKELTNGR